MSTSHDTRVCHICGTQVGPRQPCPTCVANFPNRRDVSAMSTEERVIELALYRTTLEIPFDMLHQRIEELVGRPVWTHELADFDRLIAEIRSDTPATIEGVIDQIPADKSIIAVIPVSLNGESGAP